MTNKLSYHHLWKEKINMTNRGTLYDATCHWEDGGRIARGGGRRTRSEYDLWFYEIMIIFCVFHRMMMMYVVVLLLFRHALVGRSFSCCVAVCSCVVFNSSNSNKTMLLRMRGCQIYHAANDWSLWWMMAGWAKILSKVWQRRAILIAIHIQTSNRRRDAIEMMKYFWVAASTSEH